MLGEIHHFVEGLLISAILDDVIVASRPLSYLGVAKWKRGADQLGWIGQPLGCRNQESERL
jgi:hypothetical protein